MRRLLCLFLLICLPLHSFAMQTGGIHTMADNGRQHELEHEQGIAHHHDDDGKVHYEDTAEAHEHAQQQCSNHCQGLLGALLGAASHQRVASAAPPAPTPFPPAPHLEDPERPPACAPGLATGG